jgi:hypothetical protein
MSPGPVEEAGSTARSLIESLSSSPVILALVVFNLFYIGFSTWMQIKQGERFTENQQIWERMTEKAMAFCPERSPEKRVE